VDDPEDDLRLGINKTASNAATSRNSSGWPGARAVNTSAQRGPAGYALPTFETVTFGEIDSLLRMRLRVFAKGDDTSRPARMVAVTYSCKMVCGL